MKEMFYDCFDKELKEGDDIVVACVNENGEPYILCGIVEETVNSYIKYSIQIWDDEKEIIKHCKVSGKHKLENICKIR